MRTFIGRLLLALAVLTPSAVRAADAAPLNVLFLISDDMRPELGCYGSPLVKSPNIDALAAAGVRFDKAYCQFALCNPSRSSMLTGRYPTTTGILDNRAAFRTAHPDFVSLPQHFKANGYASLRTGKIFHGGIDDPLAWTEGGDARPAPAAAKAGAKAAPKGGAPQTQAERSDRWLVLEGNGERDGDYHVADRAIEFLRKYKDRPFFLGCGFAKPHSPPAAPQRFYDLYDVTKIQLPPNFAPRPTVPDGFPRLSIRPRNADLFIGRDATPEAAREMTRAYLASISYVDWNVGRVVAELDKLGLRDKTVVVFWGDHGYHLGERGKWSKAGSVFELGARVPFIVVAPGAKGNGQVCPRVVEAVDFYPTLVEVCGLPKPTGLEGRSLAPLLADPQAKWDHPAYTVWSEDGKTLRGVSVCNERWRYADFEDGSAMLFDHVNDPQELKNLANDPQFATIRAELAPLVAKYRAGPPR
jgi:arylsulfatase A-like enzyme